MNYTESALSYDLNFWREDQPSELASEEIYAMLCEEQEVPGLAVIDVDSFVVSLPVQPEMRATATMKK